MDRLGLAQLQTREKILIYGGTGSGKSKALLSIVRAFPDNTCFMIDTDDGIGKSIIALGGEEAFPNLEYRLVDGLGGIYTAFHEAQKMLQRGDWLLLEHVGRYFQVAQDYYSQKVYQIPAAERALEVKARRKTQQRPPEDEGGSATVWDAKEWADIRNLHNANLMDIILSRSPYNVAATAGAKEIIPFFTGKEKNRLVREQRDIFTPYGFYPEGQKQLHEKFETIVFMERVKTGKGKSFVFHTLKDRERGLEEDIDFTDEEFWETYCNVVGLEGQDAGERPF